MRAFLRLIVHPLASINYLLLIWIISLGVLGIFALSSATSSEITLNRQELYAYAGLFLIVSCACVPWRAWRKLAVPVYIGSVLLLLAVPLFGVESNNARRWLDLGVITLQPSELAKVAVPLMVASFYGMFKIRRFWQHIVALGLILAPFWLVLVQPDLGTAIMLLCAGLLVVFFAGLPWLLIGGGAVVCALAAPVIWSSFLKDYQRERILTALDPYTDPLGAGYHAIQSSIAVGSGGMWGKGWGQGSQAQLGFLPEKHTDFIFAVYAEEFGFVGSVTLLGLILLVFIQMLYISARAKDISGGYVVSAFAFAFLLQALVNLGMVSGLLPVVGLPLPLVSYGGTSLMAFAMTFGIAMSVARHKPVERGIRWG